VAATYNTIINMTHISVGILPPLRVEFFPPLLTSNDVVLHLTMNCSSKAVRTTAIQLQYNCNARIFFLYCNCTAIVRMRGPLQYNATIQVFYNLQKTCTLLAAVVKKLVLQLYCTCADCCNTTNLLCYVIAVVL